LAVGIPAPRFAVGIPAPRFAVGIPAPRFAVGIPAPRFAVGIPAPRFAVGIPAPRFAVFRPAWPSTRVANGLEEATLVAMMAFLAAAILPIKDFFWIDIVALLFF
jgi:hypothetical protein